jgi:hypothetical protein
MFPRAECIANGCDGCLGVMLMCGHSFACIHDPAIGKHRCAASWTPVLWSIFLGVFAFAVVVALRT